MGNMSSSNMSFRSSGASSINTVRSMTDCSLPSIMPSVNDLTKTKSVIKDHLKGDLGDQKYKDLKKSTTLTVNNVYIRSRPLRSNGSKESECKKGLVNHDFVVVELRDKSDGSIVHIRAEKVNMAESGGQGALGGHIVIAVEVNFRFNSEQDREYRCFGSPITLQKVKEVLKTPSYGYDLIQANCWHYAAAVALGLVKYLWDSSKKESNIAYCNKLETVLNKIEEHCRHVKDLIPRRVGMGCVALAIILAVGGICAVAMKMLNEDATSEEEKDEDEDQGFNLYPHC